MYINNYNLYHTAYASCYKDCQGRQQVKLIYNFHFIIIKTINICHFENV